jgi:hypothetical protein
MRKNRARAFRFYIWSQVLLAEPLMGIRSPKYVGFALKATKKKFFTRAKASRTSQLERVASL